MTDCIGDHEHWWLVVLYPSDDRTLVERLECVNCRAVQEVRSRHMTLHGYRREVEDIEPPEGYL